MGVRVLTFSREAEADGPLSLKLAWSLYQVPSLPGLHSKSLSLDGEGVKSSKSGNGRKVGVGGPCVP